jgi:sugar-specific transcriptional regulator TrmB
MEIRILEELGLSRGEAKIYLALLEHGSLTTGPIAKYSGITNSKVYKILDRLSIKGLVSSILIGKVKKFSASNPKQVLNLIKNKKANLTDLEKEYKKEIPMLESLSKESQKNSKVEVFEGYRGLKSVFDSILDNLKNRDELFTIGISPIEGEIKNYFYHFYKKQEKIGFKIKALFNNSAREIAKERKNKYTFFRFMPGEMLTPAVINTYRDKTLINIRSKKEAFFTIVITSKETADSFRQYFNLLWKIAQK